MLEFDSYSSSLQEKQCEAFVFRLSLRLTERVCYGMHKKSFYTAAFFLIIAAVITVHTFVNGSQTDDLTALTSHEQEAYEEFKASYSDEVLIGSEPLSICKMYLFASLDEDYETAYALHTKKEDTNLWSKEQYMNIPERDRMQTFEIFRDIYDCDVLIWGDSDEHATICWKSRNGYADQDLGETTHSFLLTKEDQVWKVNFMPMQ